jgi:uncharacterized membrane protein
MKNPYLVFSFVFVALALTVSVWLYPALPASIPIHWDMNGQVDDYASKVWGVFLGPGIMLLMIGLFRLLPIISPKQYEVESFRKTYEFVVLMVIGFLGFDHVVALWAAYSGKTMATNLVLGSLFLLFAGLGNVLGKVRRNFWIGVRTPWTLASERVWIDTHRFAARLFVVTGVGGFVLTLLGVKPMVSVGVLIGAALTAVGYSLVDYKRLERRGET